MDPRATLERLSKAYAFNNWAEISDAASDLMAWIDGERDIPVPTASQLYALLVMARGYGRNRIIEIANWTESKRRFRNGGLGQ